jgi:hypothetical protein
MRAFPDAFCSLVLASFLLLFPAWLSQNFLGMH